MFIVRLYFKDYICWWKRVQVWVIGMFSKLTAISEQSVDQIDVRLGRCINLWSDMDKWASGHPVLGLLIGQDISIFFCAGSWSDWLHIWEMHSWFYSECNFLTNDWYFLSGEEFVENNCKFSLFFSRTIQTGGWILCFITLHMSIAHGIDSSLMSSLSYKQTYGPHIWFCTRYTKPLPEPMLTYHLWGPVTTTRGQFHMRYLNHQFQIMLFVTLLKRMTYFLFQIDVWFF